KALAWANLFNRYWGVDIGSSSIDLANKFATLTKRTNVSFTVSNAVDALQNPRSVGIDCEFDCIILYAVFEHLTLAEREIILRSARDALSDGGLLIVCETPNRLIRYDSHSTFLHFFQNLPTELALAYIERSPRKEAHSIISSENKEEALYRFGQGVSYHEFELYFAKAGEQPPIISDGWDMWPTFDEPIRRDELELENYVRANEVPANPAFTRYWINAVFDCYPRKAPVEAPKPVFLVPNISNKIDVWRRPQCWSADLYVSSDSALVFETGDCVPQYLQFDISESKGAFEILDPAGKQAACFEIETLKQARFPRWHPRCLVSLNGLGSCENLSIRPLDSQSRLAVEGILARATS
ncbi:MAG: class I SAM-dependent methyltransferase, partial [Methylocystis sp.]